ncbi:MAG: zinc ribbon domain-containing protein [Turneriella sp.]|nr:zinc ribbon domain-containing protein [Turneriella sp.]
MPTYDYKCVDCGRIFEKFHGINEQPQVNCPDCGSQNTTRQVSLGAGIIFKGAGFYVNDYKKASATATAEKTETKTEAKAENKTGTTHTCGPGCAHG